MSVQVQIRRGNTAQHSTFTGANGEITINTDDHTIVVHDGSTVGGYASISQAYVDNKAANAYSNATAYADNKAANAYSNAIAYSGNAAQAYSNATTYSSNATNISSGTLDTARLPATANISTALNVGANVNLSTSQINVGNATVNTVITSTSITGNGANITSVNAATVGGNTASDLRTYTDNKAANAYSNAIAYSGNAAQAYSNATSYADTKAATAYSNAIAYSGNAAQAYSNATSYADTKAATAYSNATTFASNASNISSGTLSEPRLPYRMDQNVRSTDNVQFNAVTVNNNVLVGSVNITNATINVNSIQINTSAIAIGTNFTANSTAVFSNGNITAQGNVSATYFIGDGSRLTGMVPSFQTYVFANNTTGINGYYKAVIGGSFTAVTQGSISNTVSTANTYIGGFITDTGYPNETQIPAGTFTCYFESTKSTGNQDYYIYYEVYKRTTGGTETLLLTSDQSSLSASNIKIQQQVQALLLSPTNLNTTDRLVFKFYAAVASGVQTPTITIQFDDGDQSYIIAPTQIADASRFVPYSQATANLDMNGYGINAASYSVGSNFVANTTAVSIGSNVSLTGATISGTSTDLTIRNATVQGNLVVAGSVTSVNTQSLVVNDNIIELADNNTTLDTVDSGWFSPAGNSTSVWYSGIVRQAAKSSNNNPYFWIFGSNTNPNTSTTIDTTANSVTGTLQAYLVPYGTGGAFVANSSTVLITANSTVSVNVTANNISGNGSGVTSVNAIALGGKTESQLNVNSALTSNSTTYILANTGIISNSSGVFVDAAYINTISANNAAYLGGLAAADRKSTRLNSSHVRTFRMPSSA